MCAGGRRYNIFYSSLFHFVSKGSKTSITEFQECFVGSFVDFKQALSQHHSSVETNKHTYTNDGPDNCASQYRYPPIMSHRVFFFSFPGQNQNIIFEIHTITITRIASEEGSGLMTAVYSRMKSSQSSGERWNRQVRVMEWQLKDNEDETVDDNGTQGQR